MSKVRDPNNFDKPHYETGWAGWVEAEEAIKTARKNHRRIISVFQARINEKHKE